MHTDHIYTYENEINFNIDEVKDAVKFVLTRYGRRYNIYRFNMDKAFNDVFNTYSFNENNSSYVLVLTKIDENTTKIVIKTSPVAHVSGYELIEVMEKCTMDFINILSTQLSGVSEIMLDMVEEENNTEWQNTKAGAYMGLIIMGICALCYWCFF